MASDCRTCGILLTARPVIQRLGNRFIEIVPQKLGFKTTIEKLSKENRQTVFPVFVKTIVTILEQVQINFEIYLKEKNKYITPCLERKICINITAVNEATQNFLESC